MVLNAPFTPDPIPRHALVIPRGSYAFIKVHLRRGETGPLITPDTGWEAHPSVVALSDPDLASVLSWATDELDPDDPNDVYDAMHATHTGVTGLFHDGGGNIALKVKVPVTAEITSDVNNRNYSVTWEVLRGGAGNFITNNEQFNIAEAGALVFSGSLVNWSTVTCGIYTTISDTAQQDCILQEATDTINGEMLVRCGLRPSDLSQDMLVFLGSAIKLYARHLIGFYDASAGKQLKSIREGSEQLQFQNIGGGQNTMLGNLYDRAIKMVEGICQANKKGGGFMMDTVDRYPTSQNNRGGWGS